MDPTSVAGGLAQRTGSSRFKALSCEVGGDQVWAYHPEKALTPPLSGWKVHKQVLLCVLDVSCCQPCIYVEYTYQCFHCVDGCAFEEVPYDGPVDNTFILQPAGRDVSPKPSRSQATASPMRGA